MKEYSLPARTLLLWRIRLCAAGLPIIFAAAYLCLYSVYFAAAAGILSAAVLFFSLFYLPRLHSGYKITVGDGYISVKRGVFIETERMLPSGRIISIKTSQTPLTKAFSLSAITLSAVRCRVTLAPLDCKTVAELTEFLGGDAN